jgi:TolB-like protein/Flp pilus assembly protein TadD
VTGPGSQIGPFHIERELGRGAVGVVYLAHDTKLDREVAIKSLPPEVKDNPKALSRFTREARVLASLNHPNIATIYEELEEAEGVNYLVLEYVPGQTLAERVAQGPLKLEEALTIALQIAEAVAAAHEHDVIHRDLKPGNIKITPEDKVKVLDFGLAKAVGGEEVDQQSTVTEPGRVIGTPAYMSPEQARGKPADKRSDIWSFGCVLYEMLTNRIPFKGETISDTLANVLQALPESTPTNIRVLLRHCLDKEPRRRLRDIGDVAITLEDTTIDLQRSTLPMKTVQAGQTQPAKWSRRAFPWFITGVAGMFLVLFGIIIGLKLGRSARVLEGKLVLPLTSGPIKAIVVLPFENLSGDPEQEYFVDGMTDALSAELGKIKALRVISRTSAMHYKDTDKMIPEIAKELGVDAVIEGSVLKAGNDVRVTAQLVDGRTDAHLWSDNYMGALTNILALQSQVTLAIAREIEATLTPEEEARITRTEAVNPKAYEAYLLGIHYLDKGLEPDIEVAIEYFKRALEIDSDYAIAYAGLADAYRILGNTNIRSPEDTWQNALTAAEKALAIDDGLAEAHTALAVVKYLFKWDWPGAEKEFKRALEINPNSADAHLEYSSFLRDMERYDEALLQNERASELDPHSIWVKFFKWLTLYMSGRETEAIQLVENAIESDPDQAHPYWYWWLANCYAGQGRCEEALDPLRSQINLMEEDVTDELGILGYLYGRLGQKAKALEQLEALDELAAKGRYVSPITRSLIYIGLDDRDKAFACLEEGYRRHSAKMVWLKVWFFFDTLRDDPHFQDLLRRMNFPEVPVSGPAAKPEEATQAPIEKIAVLPLTSFSSESDEDWFVDGMTDALITQLGKIKALTVISRTSAMQYKNVSKPMREIARDLGVDALIEGSVRRAGNDVEIIARLIDGRTDERIWDDLFHGTFSDILALQSQVTLAIAREIEAALTPEEERRIARTETVNPEAYEAFLKGKFFFEKFTEADFKSAVDYLEKAIEIDPNYAEAHAWLCPAYWVPSACGYSRPRESFPKARSAANKAMALDETLAGAHVSVGWIALAYDWQWQKAKQSFERARELNPNVPEVYSGLARYLLLAGRFDEAIEMMKTAVKLDPLSQEFNNGLAWMYLYSGQVERAIEQHKKTLELYPSYVEAMDGLAENYLSMSMYPEAISSVEKAMTLAGRTPRLVTRLARAYALSGRKDEAETLLRELQERAMSEYILPTFFAEVYASLGNKDEAFRWLEKGCQERSWYMLFIKIWSPWDSLRSDPRFDDFVQRMGFPE